MLYNIDELVIINDTLKKSHGDLPPGGVWRTIRGSRVYIVDGVIEAGASKLKGRRLSDIKERGEKVEQSKQKDNRREKRSRSEGNKEGTERRRKDRQRSGRDVKGVRDVNPIEKIAQKTIEAKSDKQYTYHNISGSEGAKAYHEAINDAKKDNPYGAFVHSYTEKEYGVTEGGDSHSMYLSPGGEAGFSIKGTGDIVSVFHNPKIGTKRGVAGHMLEIAIENGGNRLDCFDGFLPKLYSRYGFIPVARMKFDPKYAPEGWNFERDGEPDVIWFAHNGDDLETVRSTEYPPVDLSNVPYVDDYDKGAELQKAYIESRDTANSIITKSLLDIQKGFRW